MWRTLLNGENEQMRIATATAVLAAAVFLAACGSGGGNKPKTPAGKTGQGAGGTVSAEATKGLIGPAAEVSPSGTKITGKTGPLSAKENRPTDAQQHGVAGGVTCGSASANPAPSNLDTVSATILCLLNAERAANGMAALKSNGSLARAAKGWSGAMVSKRVFAHELGSSSPLSRIKKTGYVRGSWQIGENIAWGSGALASPQSIVNGWMHSPPHRANILHASFRDIGIGVTLGAPGPGLSGGATYVTDFGKH